MKLLLVRHGESQDDILDAYGGWADFPLTDKGKQQIQESAKKTKDLNIPFDMILASPLTRAQESAQIISTTLNIPVETFEYIKERNTYGILCGMVKSAAKEKYPWLVEAYDKDEYVDGSERGEDIKQRAKKAYQLIQQRSEKSLILVTHGNFLKALIPQILPDKKLTKKQDGGFILIDTDTSEVLTQQGIEVA